MHGLDVRQRGMQAASDEETFDHRAQDARVVVSADTDFGTLLALRKLAAPSVILFRRGSQHRSVDQAELLKVNLPHSSAPSRPAASPSSGPTASGLEHCR